MAECAMGRENLVMEHFFNKDDQKYEKNNDACNRSVFLILLLGGFSLFELNLKFEKVGIMRVQPEAKQMTGMTDHIMIHNLNH